MYIHCASTTAAGDVRSYGKANSNNSVIFVFASPGFQCGVGFLKSRSRGPSDFASSYGTVFTWDTIRGGHFDFFFRHGTMIALCGAARNDAARDSGPSRQCERLNSRLHGLVDPLSWLQNEDACNSCDRVGCMDNSGVYQWARKSELR
jgi:hypothetical protein